MGEPIESEIDSLNVYEKDFISRLIGENDFNFYNKVFLNKVLYNVHTIDTKFSNSVIKFEEKFGLIVNIVTCDGKLYMICREFLFLSNPFCCSGFNLKSNFALFKMSRRNFMIEKENFVQIKKLFYFLLDETTYLISTFTSNHIFT